MDSTLNLTDCQMDGQLDGRFLEPPPNLFARLRQIAGYTWDETKEPLHSSYDNWQVIGTRLTKLRGASSPTSNPRRGTPRSTSAFGGSQKAGSESESDAYSAQVEEQIQVVARVSHHALREERAYQQVRSVISSVDPDGNHIIRPVEFVRLSPQQGDKGPLVVCIFVHPGPNRRLVDYGPAWYWHKGPGKHEPLPEISSLVEPVSLQIFLDFAIGATECLEILHHGQRVVHGEIRGDAFHWNQDTGKVILVNFGSGLRTFEHGLTSTGWSSLSQEIGAKTKLSYMSPEQTGRMPAEPDSRTDIYSLGILLWTMLTQQVAFEGQTPMDIIQGVLGRRLPSVSSIRIDVPDVIGRIIQKMTAKQLSERYNSASGLRYDLSEVRRLIGEGNASTLKNWPIATKDVSSFFVLPSIMIGRSTEHDEIVKIIEKVSNRHISSQRQDLSSVSSGSVSENFPGNTGDSDADSSDAHTSTLENPNLNPGNDLGLGLGVRNLRSGSGYNRSNTTSQYGSSSQSNSNSKPWENNYSNPVVDSPSIFSSIDNSAIGASSEGAGSLTNQRNKHKYRRKGRCEVVTIAGAAGLGKSCLVQSVQLEARRRGYFASSKFDQSRKIPFGPVLKLLSSLFKQVFSESNTSTAFHQVLKQYVRPAWPMLHKILGLPEFLLDQRSLHKAHKTVGSGSNQFSPNYHGLRSDFRTRDSSPSSTQSLPGVNVGSQSSQDFLRAGSSTRSTRLMGTFLDVLRVFTQHKFICLCLDDLQFADDESLDLIAQIVEARMRMVIIVTLRPDEVLPDKIKGIVNPPSIEEYKKSGGMGLTRVSLNPLTEEDIVQYVAATLCRPKEQIKPLAAIIQSKTAGNPFYIREMLNTCVRWQCIYYDYKESVWQYDVDKMFAHFVSKSYNDVLDNKFVTERLKELPAPSRSILAWASLLGTSFSFDLVLKLMSGEFDYKEADPSTPSDYCLSISERDAIGGLQAAIQAYILVATQDDDRFRFAHDRYLQAAYSLRDSNGPKMNFIIAQTLINYFNGNERARDTAAPFICEAISIINDRITHRHSFRRLLFDCAQAAAETGARPTAIRFYTSCFSLLQENPWIDGEDRYYDETLQLYTRAAECYLFMGQHQEAKRLIDQILSKAMTSVHRAPAWILQSRISAQEGDYAAAFRPLKQCLLALKVQVDDAPTYEKCDAEFQRLSTKIQSLEAEDLIQKSMTNDPNVAAVGAVLVEAINGAFWTDSLTFYQMTLVMVSTHLTSGSFPQAGIGFLHLAMVAISRFNMISFASQMGNISLAIGERYREIGSLGRGGTIYHLFIGHIQSPLSAIAGQLEGALEYAIQAGDRASTILNFGLVSMLKFFSSEHLTDLESFCVYGCEEIPSWHLNTRGGTMIIAVRQVCRALQGKTSFGIAERTMDDEQHDSVLYKSWLRKSTKADDRPILLYESLELVPLFLYGHYAQASKIGMASMKSLTSLWSARNTRFIMLFYGLAKAGLIWTRQHDPLRATKNNAEASAFEGELREEISSTKLLLKELKKKIEDWQEVTDVNYVVWSKLLAAQVSEMEGNHGTSLQQYEESLDHASAYNFVFEEALGNYLLAGFFLRTGSKRSAKAALRESIMLYRLLGAVGVARRIEDEHSLMLQHSLTLQGRFADVGVQTDFAGDSAVVQYQQMEDDGERQETRASMTETKGDRIGAWQGGSARPDAGGGLPALDMLDLTSILESSQVISSVLQVDQLLKTMCEIILANCGGFASLAAIVVEDDDPVGWSIAASGEPEGAVAHIPSVPLSESSLVAESVILYCTRFRETVFLPNLLLDERFSNVSLAWSERNPMGKSVIAIPIKHGVKPLLGVLYLEGEPNAFTDRNLTVLELLVNQIGISYSNALTLKEVERVSAFNTQMIDIQKRALANALEAEKMANKAKAEALRNVKLAEEAAKAKSIFLANVSHELRTPLNGVIGNSELLRDSELRKDQAEMADSIRVSADLLLTVINDILDFSKMEADKMKLFIVAFNPDEMIREVVRSVSYSNRDKKSSKNVEIIQSIDLPQSLIFGDPVRLHQVLGNLIGNSLKFTENGSITVGAQTDWETEKAAKLTFWVKDTGIGIPSQQLDNLFKPFSQADASTARKYGGSGLGLSICKSLIESMMGGRIELESVEGAGTIVRFTVTFPKANATASAGDSQSTPPQTIDQQKRPSSSPYMDFSHIPRERLRIAIAEDNPINQKIALQFLEKLGFPHVDAYDNGSAAVEGLRKKANEGTPYQIILMDVQMPVCDGYEATKLLRKDTNEDVRGVLVIAMTASAIQGDREKCLAAGMNDYLAKPVRSMVLKKKLDQYLQQPPLSLPNIQAQAVQVTKDVLEGSASHTPSTTSPYFSALASPSDLSGVATPKSNSRAESLSSDLLNPQLSDWAT